MAFCPLCGKKLPDNGICSCGKKLDENGNIVSNIPEAAPVQLAADEIAAQQAAVQADVQQVAVQAEVQQAAAQAEVQQVAAQTASQMNVQQAAPQPNSQQAAPQPNPQQAVPQPNLQQAAPQPNPQPAAPQVNPQQVFAQQKPEIKAAPQEPAGPSVFGEAVKLFAKAFKNPLGAKQDVLDDKVPIGSPMILGGVYFFVVWWSLTLLLVGSCSIKFLPAWGFGALGGLFFYGIRCGAAFLISTFAKNPDVKFVKTIAAMFVDTILLDCILVVMMLFQFATVYFAVFFLLIYLGLIFYQNTELFRKLSGTDGVTSVKMFWFNFVLIVMYAFLIMIAYIIFNNIPASAYKISNIWDW